MRPRPRWTRQLDDHLIAVGISADRSRVAAATVSGSVLVFDATDGASSAIHPGHEVGASDVAWHPERPVLASAGQDGAVLLWQAGGVAPKRLEVDGRSWVERVAWSPDGELLAASAGRRVHLWRNDGTPAGCFDGHASTVTDLVWSPDGSALGATCYGGVTLWRPQGGEPVRLEWTGSSLVLAWSPTGRHLATGDQDATVHFWLVDEGTDLQMSGYFTKVRELAWDSTGRYLATGGGPAVTVWDCAPPGPAGSQPAQVEMDDQPVSRLAAQRRGGHICAGGADGELVFFRAAAPRRQRRLELDDEVSALDWSSDDRFLLAGTGGGLLARIDP